MKPNEVGSAFPHPEVARVQDGRCVVANADTGMSLRDWFAGKALAGMLAADPNNTSSSEIYAIASYALADAMLKAREDKP